MDTEPSGNEPTNVSAPAAQPSAGDAGPGFGPSTAVTSTTPAADAAMTAIEAAAEPPASIAARVREMVTPKRLALGFAGLGIAIWAVEEISWRWWRTRWRYRRAFTGALIRRIDRW